MNLLFVWGWAAILAGQVWGISFPINKPLWTSSYVLFTAGSGRAVNLYAWAYRNLFASWLGPMLGSLGFAIAVLLLCYAVAEVLFRKRIFIKV